MRVVGQTLIFLLRLYQWVLSPIKRSLFGPFGRCRFSPSCSDYAIEALQRHGVWRGSVLALRRLLRCQPWGGCGWDPVPPNENLAFRVDHSGQRTNNRGHETAPHEDVIRASVR